MTKYQDLFDALAAPFPIRDVKTRSGGGGRQLSYITQRTAQNRIDAVFGPENWKVYYKETRQGVKARLYIRMPDGEWIGKEDGGAAAEMPELDNNEKSGYADAFKRVAAVWGVGRYLYNDGVPDHSGSGNARPPGEPLASSRPPELPREQPRQESSRETEAVPSGMFGQIPQDSKALYKWCKNQEDATGYAIVKFLDSWAKANELEYKWDKWPARAVSDAWVVVVRMICEKKSLPLPENVIGYKLVGEEGDTTSAPPAKPSAPSRPKEPQGEGVHYLQSQLSDIVTKIAKGVLGPQDDDAAFAKQFWETVKEVGVMASTNGGVDLIPNDDFENCDDRKTLQAYVDAAKVILEDMPF